MEVWDLKSVEQRVFEKIVNTAYSYDKTSVLSLLILSMIIFYFLWKEYEAGGDFVWFEYFEDDDEMSIIVDAKEKNEHHCSIEIKIKLVFYRVWCER